MKPLVIDDIENLKPYVPGKPVEELERELGIKDPIKLASNENPLGPSPQVVEAIREGASRVHIYPDGAAHYLRTDIADFHGVELREVAVGAGSDELLTLAVNTFCEPGDQGVVSEHSFAAYKIALKAHGCAVVEVPMADGLVSDIDRMVDAITDRTKILFLANPNNPTGTYVPADKLRSALRRIPEDVVVVVDEAYHDYVQADDYTSALEMRYERGRLIVCRTFSKCYGLAGLRVGYAISQPRIIDYLNRVRKPFNTSLIGQHAARVALADRDYVRQSVAVNEQGRAILEQGLAQMEGLGVSWTPSQTNFLLVRTPYPAQRVYDAMLRKGVILRPMAGYGLPEQLRVSIGTAGQLQTFLSAFDETLQQMGGSI